MPKSQAIKLIIDKFFVNYMQKMKILGGYVYVFMSMLNIIWIPQCQQISVI